LPRIVTLRCKASRVEIEVAVEISDVQKAADALAEQAHPVVCLSCQADQYVLRDLDSVRQLVLIIHMAVV
jgi:hypothetical protein